jgi:hypothetical protein
MMTYVHLWYVAEFFLEWGMFQTEVVEKINTHYMPSNFFVKIVQLWDKVEKYGRARQATDDNIILCMHDR